MSERALNSIRANRRWKKQQRGGRRNWAMEVGKWYRPYRTKSQRLAAEPIGEPRRGRGSDV